MKLATSRLTRPGQISVPADIVLRRGGKVSCLDIHRAAFGDEPPTVVSIDEMDAAITSRLIDERRHANRDTCR